MSQSEIEVLKKRLAKSGASRAEWERRANIAEEELAALKAKLSHEQPNHEVEDDGVMMVGAPDRGPSWIASFLMTFGVFTVIAVAIFFVTFELWQSTDAWLLLSILVMAGCSLVAIGHRLRSREA